MGAGDQQGRDRVRARRQREPRYPEEHGDGGGPQCPAYDADVVSDKRCRSHTLLRQIWLQVRYGTVRYGTPLVFSVRGPQI